MERQSREAVKLPCRRNARESDAISMRNLVMNRINSLKGVIHGKLIELDRDPGLPDGQKVTVAVETPTSPCVPFPTDLDSREGQTRWEAAWAEAKELPPGEGLRRSAGAWADDAEGLDEYLEWNRSQRKVGRPEPES